MSVVDHWHPDFADYDGSRMNYPRRATNGTLVAVLRRTVPDRGLVLIRQRSRCIRQGEVHELILTEEETAAPDGRANKVAYLGFVEFTCGGVVVTGDRFSINGQEIGELVGYDETHMPNHMNILIRGKGFVHGYERGLMPGDQCTFRSPYPDERVKPGTSEA